jgi:lipid A 3-O-deacylase
VRRPGATQSCERNFRLQVARGNLAERNRYGIFARVVLGKKWFMVALMTLTVVEAASALDFDLRLQSTGVRGGWAANTEAHAMHQVEAFGIWEMPWCWRPAARFYVQPEFEAAAGGLTGHGNTAFVGRLGPDLLIGWKDFPLTFQGGAVPTIISRHTFGDTTDVGSLCQFTTYIGFNWNFYSHYQLGYRFQHMSNAGLATPNPGLNLHMVAFSYLF